MSILLERKSNLIPHSSAEAALAENAADSAFATTLAKGLVVLEAFESGPRLLGNMELSARTGIPRPTVARLTHTLAEIGYLRYDEQVAKYRLGVRPLRMARPLLAGMEFRQISRPLMQELAESVRGTVSIGLLDGSSIIYIETARSGNVGPHVPDIGMSISTVMTAMGRAAAAVVPARHLTLLEERMRANDADLWSAYRNKYRAGIRQCADRGFCTCFGEYMTSIHAVAAPLFYSQNLRQSFAINCGVPAFRLQPGQLESEVGPRIAALAVSIRSLVNEAEPTIAPREEHKKKPGK
jgi:DNA-binding IclR family transcriptional regulator